MPKKNLAILEEFHTDVTVGMTEVVNVFVTQYEDALHAEKKRLSGEIKSTKSTLTQLEKSVEDEVAAKHTDYVFENKKAGIASTFERVEDVDWKEGVAVLEMKIYDTDAKSRGYRESFTKAYDVKLKKADIKSRTSLKATIDTLTGDLQVVLGNIKDIGRKERQVRGEISKRKLESAGYKELLNDSNLKALVQL